MNTFESNSIEEMEEQLLRAEREHSCYKQGDQNYIPSKLLVKSIKEAIAKKQNESK